MKISSYKRQFLMFMILSYRILVETQTAKHHLVSSHIKSLTMQLVKICGMKSTLNLAKYLVDHIINNIVVDIINEIVVILS